MPSTNGGELFVKEVSALTRMETNAPTQWLLVAERSFALIGCLLSLIYVGVYSHLSAMPLLALREFDRARESAAQVATQPAAESAVDGRVDFGRWSQQRIVAYDESAAVKEGSPIAVLRPERPNFRVPVYEGADDWTLNWGAGWIPLAARPGEAGNIGIAGPKGVHVLQPRFTISLTLATCYRFYFVGDIPQRFIVHAVLDSQDGNPILKN